MLKKDSSKLREFLPSKRDKDESNDKIFELKFNREKEAELKKLSYNKICFFELNEKELPKKEYAVLQYKDKANAE